MVGIALAGLLMAASGAAQDGARARPAPRTSGGAVPADQACYDVRHYRLQVDVAPADRRIDGVLTMRAEAIAACPAFALDLDELLQVAGVSVDGRPAEFEHRERRLLVTPSQPIAAGAAFVCEVRYGGAPLVAIDPPRRGGIVWAETDAGEPWIATCCLAEGADVWWPCKDHPGDRPDGFELLCTVPEGLVVAGPGIEVTPPASADARTTFHWRTETPIAPSAVAMQIGPFVELTDTIPSVDDSEVPLRWFVLPTSERAAKRCMRQFVDHLRVFEGLLGPYPFRREKYGLAEAPGFTVGHQTLISYGGGFRDEQWDGEHVRALANEWFGHLVGYRDHRDLWLADGFATFLLPLYREVRFGERSAKLELDRQGTTNRRPIAPREPSTSRQVAFGSGRNDLASKGCLLLHTLRYRMGDEPFLTALRRWCYPDDRARGATDGSQVRLADTDEFVRLCSELADEDLSWFFEVYARRAPLPQLITRLDAGTLHLRWQVPDDLPFDLSVPVRVGGFTHDVEMKDGSGEIGVAEAPFAIDPGKRVLMAPPRRER